MEQIRLNKAISESGKYSRREGDRLIEAGRVKVNGVVAEMGLKVTRDTDIYVDDQLINKRDELVYIMLNKPRGITSTTDLKDQSNIIEYINHEKRIFPIGRLDKPSTGLILLTNDGDIVNRVLRSENNHEKEYIVRVNKPITRKFIMDMANGVPIMGTTTKKCKVEKISTFKFKIILTEGLNRQIRRMCAYFDYEVYDLHRIRIMNVELNDLPNGEWRDLTKEELVKLLKLTESSEK